MFDNPGMNVHPVIHPFIFSDCLFGKSILCIIQLSTWGRCCGFCFGFLVSDFLIELLWSSLSSNEFELNKTNYYG